MRTLDHIAGITNAVRDIQRWAAHSDGNEDALKEVLVSVAQHTYREGMCDGMRAFAWWRDGV